MGRKKRFSCGIKSCFDCPYPDCLEVLELKEYQKRYREEHKERLNEQAKQWYYANKEEINAKKRAAREQARQQRNRICYWCSKEHEANREVVKYNKNYFCSEICLGAYLVADAKKHGKVNGVVFMEGDYGPEKK